MDRKKQETKSIVIRHDILHNYKNRLHSETRKLNVKTKSFTFVVFTNTFNIVPEIYNVRLGYNDAPSNTIKVHFQYPLQCYDKTETYERFNTNDDKYQTNCWHEADNLRRLQPLHYVLLQSKIQSSELVDVFEKLNFIKTLIKEVVIVLNDLHAYIHSCMQVMRLNCFAKGNKT